MELGFISNSEDNQLFNKNFENYANAISKGICNYLSLPYDKKSNHLARIQVRAYTYPENEKGARESLKLIQALGIQHSIKELESVFLIFPTNN